MVEERSEKIDGKEMTHNDYAILVRYILYYLSLHF